MVVWSSSEQTSHLLRNSIETSRELTWRLSGENCIFTSPVPALDLLSSGTAQKCGVFYLTVSSLTSTGELKDFDSLQLVKKCSDRPGLSLNVVRRENKVAGCCGYCYWFNIVLIYFQVVNALRKGSVNPFKIIGIDSISVANTVQNCSKDYTDCNNQTDIQVD